MDATGETVSRVIRARYEKGVLKPLEELRLEEGEEVEIVVRRRAYAKKLLGKYRVEGLPSDKHLLLDEVYGGEA